MATLNVEDLPVEGSDLYGVRAYSDNLATAIAKALQEALPESDHEFRVVWLTYTTKDDYWVCRYRVLRNPNSPVTSTVLDFVVGGGLCVVTNRHGSWIVPSPQREALGIMPWRK